MDHNEFDRKTDSQQVIENESKSETIRVIPVIEEQLLVGKEVVETGKVRITKKVQHEEVTVNDLLVSEEVNVERIAVNKYVEAAPQSVRHEGDKMIISVLKEVIVVEKRLLLVEELHVTRKKVETQVPHQVTLRKEEIAVERTDSNNQNL